MTRRSKGGKPSLLVLNQYYWPGFEATARLLHELCVALSDEFEVTVITGMLNLEGVTRGRSVIDGVTVIRVGSTAYDRARLLLRGVNYVTYLAHALRAALSLPPPDAILCLTDPPVIGDVALVAARRFRAPLVVVSQDVFPEVAAELGLLRNRVLVEVLRLLTQFYVRRADRLVAIGETMRVRLEQKGASSDRLTIIPNWVQTKTLVPSPQDNEWSRGQGLAGRFVVMHSGNVGHAQNLDALVRAATLLRDLDDLSIVIVGSGARHAALVELADRLDADCVRFLPYQPRDVLALSLSSASVHVVGLASGLAGYVVPSRVYGILSVGRPLIVAADPESETAELIRRVGCGLLVPPGQPAALAVAIRSAHDGDVDLAAMGGRARGFAVAEADRDIAVERYRRLLHEVTA